jgi:hypothetical protein
MFANCNNINCLIKIKNIPKDFNSLPFGRQIEYNSIFSAWKKEAESTHVGCKHKASLSAVRRFLKEVKPKEYYARWQKDTNYSKADSVEVFYKL